MIKNVKVLCKKIKIKKLRLCILPLFMSTVLATGCKNISSVEHAEKVAYETNIDNLKQVDEQVVQDSINQQYINKENFIIEQLDDEQLRKIDTYVSFEENELNSINDQIDNTAYYKYSEYFEIPEALKKYDEYKEAQTYSSNIIINKKVDVEKLYNSVLKNNALFLNESVNSSIFNEFSKTEVHEICNIISDALNTKISTLSLDIDELDTVLSDLKILSFNNYVYATITVDNCLAINKEMISSLDIENAFEKTITHESMHLIQKGSEKEQELEGYSKNVGMNYKWQDLKVNSLYNDWLIESSAEKSAYTITNEETNYKKELAYLDALEICMAFEDFNVTDLDLSKDLSKFYESFSCDGLISREEIATMMYAINYINANDMLVTEESDFLTNYKNFTNSDLKFKEQRELKSEYVSTVYKTLARKLYYDLTTKLNSGQIKVTDAFSMIVLFETSCAKNVGYHLDSRIPYNETFLKEYNELQTTFFETISSKVDMSVEEIQKAYNSYHNYDILINFTNKNSYLNDIYTKIKQNKSVSINQVYNNMNNVKGM